VKDLTRIVEALLFTADGTLKTEQVLDAVPEAKAEAVERAFGELQRFYDETNRAYTLAPLAGGYQLLTRPDLSPWVERFLVGRRRQRLSRAALEVLAVVAYRQPVTRGDVEAVRGVDCGGVFRTLLERKMVRVKGRAKTVGHPLLYATTDHFLEHFGIAQLKDLPKLEEFEAMIDREEAREELQQSGILTAAAQAASDGQEAEPDAQAPAAGGVQGAEAAEKAAQVSREEEAVQGTPELLGQRAGVGSGEGEVGA
jgi:segregation and condensation protein B